MSPIGKNQGDPDQDRPDLRCANIAVLYVSIRSRCRLTDNRRHAWPTDYREPAEGSSHPALLCVDTSRLRTPIIGMHKILTKSVNIALTGAPPSCFLHHGEQSMGGHTERPAEAENVRRRWHRISAAQLEFTVLLSLVIGATSAFAALLRVAVQQISGAAMHLAELAVGACLLHGILLLLIRLTNPDRIVMRHILTHVSGALLAGSLFGGLASIWH